MVSACFLHFHCHCATYVAFAWTSRREARDAQWIHLRKQRKQRRSRASCVLLRLRPQIQKGMITPFVASHSDCSKTVARAVHDPLSSPLSRCPPSLPSLGSLAWSFRAPTQASSSHDALLRPSRAPARGLRCLRRAHQVALLGLRECRRASDLLLLAGTPETSAYAVLRARARGPKLTSSSSSTRSGTPTSSSAATSRPASSPRRSRKKNSSASSSSQSSQCSAGTVRKAT